ncbi:helicase-associated domain-containing protein [Cellulomonas timonensis]|uniref:helicase-associated domain-containing protein n=1 Tax=Cellulomonas timonensis TaxID=1689271 RepID=UPI00082D39CE|nr:helicase-associated domain-containing protein [Cellulomonas timonensis]
MVTFTEHLRARGDDELVALLLQRPDLAAPSPSTLSSLAARASSRTSLERALATVDASVLQALEALVALTDGGGSARRDDVAAAVGAQRAPRDRLDRALDRAHELALVWTDEDGVHPAPGLAELLGPYPAGLAPATATQEPPVDLGVLDDAPAAARSVLDALTWGPPVGIGPPAGSPAAAAVDWLLERRLLVPGDARHVVLPRAVALALRGGRTHRAPATPPEPAPTGVAHAEALVAAESAAAAERFVRLVALLVRTWEQTPAPVLRSGGLGGRELRRVAATLEVEDSEAAFVVELAAAAGLIAEDEEESPAFAPTLAVDEWLNDDLPSRWATLARAWATTVRTPWMVGGRDERGGVRAALDPELSRPWAPRVRHAVLTALAEVPPGTVLRTEAVLELLRWRTPRSVPPEAAVAATLHEAGMLGVLGAGALSPAGRALLEEVDRSAHALPTDAEPGITPEAALATALPEPVSDLLLQGDLTGIVPGRPTPELAALLERSGVIESRGAALTVRFTPESIRAALDVGGTADDLLAGLAAHARGGIPQPLEYMIRDAGRRHGQLRAGYAASYLRADDPALLAGLVDNPALAELGLMRLAPTVLGSVASPRELLAVLREHGLAPLAEGPGGQVLHPEPQVRRVRNVRRNAPHKIGAAPSRRPDTLTSQERAGLVAQLVPTLREAEREGSDAASGEERRREPALANPVSALSVLREAAAQGREVWLEMVGPHGVHQRRRVRPVHVEGGRVRVRDEARDAELTVAVHRIASATPV